MPIFVLIIRRYRVLPSAGSFGREPGCGGFGFDLRLGRGPGAGLVLAEACQPVQFSTPFFLAAQRRVVSSRQEEVAFRLRWRA